MSDPYIVPGDVKEAAGPDGNTANTAALLSDTQLATIISEAQGTVDGYIGSRYNVPVASPVPVAVKSLTTAVALYLATLTFRRSKDLAADDPVVRRYNHAMQMLRDIAAGEVIIVFPPDANASDVVLQNVYDGNLFDHTVVPDYFVGVVKPHGW